MLEARCRLDLPGTVAYVSPFGVLKRTPFGAFFYCLNFPFSEPIDKLQARFHYSNVRYVLTNASELTFFLDNG